MADKFIIHGATYNGDGTTSSEAASAGAAGAWNNVEVIIGTAVGYGSLDAGDVVYIRSKSSAGADLTITTGTAKNVGKASLTGTQQVRWILDNGTVWSGIDGTLTLTLSANVTYTILAGNILEAKTQDAIAFTGWASNPNGLMFKLSKGSSCIKTLFDNTANTSNGAYFNFEGWLYEPHIKLGYRTSYGIVCVANGQAAYLVNPNIELTLSAEKDPVFSSGGTGTRVVCYGGKISGSGAVSDVPVAANPTTNNGDILLYGMNYPYAMQLTTLSWNVASLNTFIAIGSDGALGSTMDSYVGRIDSRRDGNYPTCNATLPDSVGTAWSFLLSPRNAQPYAPMTLPISKLYSSADATKTITLELLVGDAFTEINKSNLPHRSNVIWL